MVKVKLNDLTIEVIEYMYEVMGATFTIADGKVVGLRICMIGKVVEDGKDL